MTLKQLEYFIALAESCHFSKTANELYVSQSTLSHSIAELETELGVELFSRNGNSVTLTTYGDKYVNMIRPIISGLGKANSYLKELSLDRISSVHIGTFPSLYTDFASLFIKKFNETYPNDNIDLNFYDRKRTFNLVSELKSGIIDMTLSTVEDDELQSAFLFSQKYYLFVPDGHRLASKDSVCFDDFKNESFIVVAKHMSSRPFLDSIFESRGTEMKIRSEQIANYFVLNYVANNYGPAIIPYSKAYLRKGINAIPIDDAAFNRSIYLLWNDKALSSDAAKIIDLLIKNAADIYQESIK